MQPHKQDGKSPTSGDNSIATSPENDCNTTTNKPITVYISDVSQNTLLLDIETIQGLTNIATNKRIMSIKKEFNHELRQINILIKLIFRAKDIGFILGMPLKEIVKGLKYYDKFFLFKSTPYVLHLLEQLSDPNISLLEYSKDNSLYNVTTFSLAFHNHDEKQEIASYLV